MIFSIVLALVMGCQGEIKPIIINIGCWLNIITKQIKDSISGVMVSMVAMSVVDLVFKFWKGQTKFYK